jgi:hypothetical protein
MKRNRRQFKQKPINKKINPSSQARHEEVDISGCSHPQLKV